MKTRIFSIILFFLVLTIPTIGQDTETRQLPSFSSVQAGEGIEVYLQKGSREEARIVADNIDIRDVRTDVEAGRLKIHLEGDNHNRVEVTVYVTYVQLNGVMSSSASSITGKDKIVATGGFEVDVSSAGDIDIDLKADKVEIEASSSGQVTLVVEADALVAKVSSAGQIDITGSAEKTEVSASSSGKFDGYEFRTDAANLKTSSGATIRISVEDKIEAYASSGGNIRYKGSPDVVNAASSSGGSISKF